MEDTKHNPAAGDVPQRVFEEFLRKLEADKLPAATIERLRTLLLSGKSLTEKAVTEALLPEEPLV